MALPLALPDRFAGHVYAARELVRRKQRTTVERLTTGTRGFDALLDGGLERGGTLELLGRASSGRFSLVLAMLAATTARGEPAALIDRGSALDPQAAETAGADLPFLLWARPRDMRETLASAEIVLDVGMPLVVVELGLPPLEGGRGAEAAWLRLSRAARARHTALVVAAPYRVSGTAAGTVIEARGGRPRWHPGCSRPHAPRLLHGLDTRLVRIKQVVRATDGSSDDTGMSSLTVAEAVRNHQQQPEDRGEGHSSRRRPDTATTHAVA